MSRRYARWLWAIVTVCGASASVARPLFETGPLPSFSGAPAVASKPEEYNCSVCHANFEWNNLNTPGGGIELLGLPTRYRLAESYAITVRLHSDSTARFPGRRWGFQLTAVSELDGEGCGTFELADLDSLQIVTNEVGPFATRRYVTHTALGRRDSLMGGASWTFSWRAPGAPAGRTVFSVAGVAANGDSELNNDFVFTRLDTVGDEVTPVVPVSWGQVKLRYR